MSHASPRSGVSSPRVALMNPRAGLRFPWLGLLALSACQADTQSLGRGGLDATARPAADASLTALDAGSCTTESPAGCSATGCAPPQVCDPTLGCKPSACLCTEGGWSCDDDCGGGTCRLPELVFELSYATDTPGGNDVIYAQSGAEPEWIRIFDATGAEVRARASCGLCPCDSCGNCPVCGQGIPLAEPLQAGQSVRWRWDTQTHPLSRCATGGAACEASVTLPAGTYVARFCYGRSIIGIGPGGTQVQDVVCQDVPFRWPNVDVPDGVIRHRVCDCG